MSYVFSHKLRQQCVNYRDSGTDHVLIGGPDPPLVSDSEPAAPSILQLALPGPHTFRGEAAGPPQAQSHCPPIPPAPLLRCPPFSPPPFPVPEVSLAGWAGLCVPKEAPSLVQVPSPPSFPPFTNIH